MTSATTERGIEIKSSAEYNSAKPNNIHPQSSSVSLSGGKERVITHETPAVSRDAIQPLSGLTNYTEGQHYLFSEWMKKVATAYAKYGFTSFQPRPFELSKNLMVGGIGHQVYGVHRESDRVKAEKQATVKGSLEDQSAAEKIEITQDSVEDQSTAEKQETAKDSLENQTTRYALPYDRTVPLAIFVATRLKEITFPYKRQDIRESFRGEHAQAGRFNAFIQCDADIIDRSLNTIAEYECLMAMIDALKSLNVGSFVVSVNDIKIAKALIKEAGIPQDKEQSVLREIDKMDKNPPAEVCEKICGLLPDFDPADIKSLVQKFQFKGAPKDFPISKDTSPEMRQAYRDLGDVYSKLTRSGVRPESLQVNFGMVRGLDYYTGIVFETFLDGKERFGSVASGGRYDNLVGAFSPQKDIQGLGCSIGLTRLFHVLQVEPDLEIPRKSVANFLVGYRTVELQDKAVEIATALREQGINVDLYTNPKGKVKDQFKYANSKGIPNTIMVMDNGALVLKDMLNNTHADKGTEYSSVDKVVAAAITQNKQQEMIEQTKLGFEKIKGDPKAIQSLKDSLFY